MYKRLKTLTVAFAVVVFTGAFTAHAQDQKPDRVFLQGQNQPKLGLVVEETMDHLIWKPKSPAGDSYMGEENVSWRKIRGIRFGEQPDPYLNARKLHQQGKSPEKAIELLEEIITKKEVNRTFFIPRARYLKADILYKNASSEEEFREALKAYNTAIEKNPNNKGFYEAVQRKIEIYRKLGESEKAIEAADLLVEKNPQSVGKAYGTFIKAQIREEQRNFEKAAKHYRSTINHAGDSGENELQLRVRVKLGNTLMKLERYSDAREVFKEIIDRKEQIPERLHNTLVLAAQNGFGRTLYHLKFQEDAEADEARQKNIRVLKDALLYFMKGVIWYTPPNSGSKIEYERSLYWVAKSYSKLAKNVSDQDRKEEYKREARRALKTLFNRYPETALREQARRLQRSL